MKRVWIHLVQVAIIAGNFELAEIIKIHKASDVGEFKHITVVCVCVCDITEGEC